MTEGVFVTGPSGNAGVSVGRIVRVTTNIYVYMNKDVALCQAEFQHQCLREFTLKLMVSLEI